jgi:hypothetical protein
MPIRYNSPLFRAASALAFLLVLAACTPGGQFDPTEIFNSDAFDSKSKIKGQREPVFPNGVPGTTTGVPADLVKGYRPPPDQANVDADAVGAPAPAAATRPEAKPKPKPKVAVARLPKQNAAIQKPPSSAPARIDIGATGAPAQQSTQATWPNSPPPAAPQQAGQVAWPAPPSTAPSQQAAQPSQSIWPNPPPAGTSSQ